MAIVNDDEELSPKKKNSIGKYLGYAFLIGVLVLFICWPLLMGLGNK